MQNPASRDYLKSKLTSDIVKCEKKIERLKKLLADKSGIENDLKKAEADLKVFSRLLEDNFPSDYILPR